MENHRPRINGGTIAICICVTAIAATGIRAAAKQVERINAETKHTAEKSSITATAHMTSETTAENTPDKEIINEQKEKYDPAPYEMNMLCATVISEAGYCDAVTQKAIVHTVLNRIDSEEFPNTITDVVTEPNQYDGVNAYINSDYPAGLEPGSEAWDHTVNYLHLRSLRSLRSGGLSLSGSENDFLNLLPL